MTIPKVSVPISPVSKKWVSLLLGLGISVPTALLPLFGKLGIPPFKGLLALIPESIQPVVIPLGCAAMALMSISVEFRVMAKAPKEKLLAEAKKGLLLTGALLVAFCIAYSFLVTVVHLLGGKESVSVVTGFANTSAPPCVGFDVEGCVKYLTLSESAIASYFGDRQIRLAKLILEVLYIGFFAAFGNLAGILVSLQTRTPATRGRSRAVVP